MARPIRIGCSGWVSADCHPGRHAFELRHASWFVPEVEALLREHGAALGGFAPRNAVRLRELLRAG